MTVVADQPAPSTAPTARTSNWRSSRWLPLAAVLGAFAILSTTRILSDTADLTSSGTFGVALRTAAPIGLAGLSGLVAERSGTINIGLDGMMVLGTIFAGWWGWEYGPWAALLGGIIGGMIGGLVMSVATTTFGVNHIVAGVAINLIAPGAARFMAGELFVDTQGGAITTSPGNKGAIGAFTVPFLSGGDLFGWTSPDILGWIEDHGWFLVADLAAVVKGATTAVTWDVVLTIVVFFGVAYLLWRTPIGLRLRSAGERPAAADSLGVSVHRMRYLGMGLSGALAGMGGAVLVLFSNRYQEGQAVGRGFLGLATMIFGNWMPGGTALGAGLFGYAQGITLRTNPADLVSALILAAAISLAVLAVWMAFGKNWRSMGFIAVFTAITFWAFFAASQPNNQLVYITPYVVTLLAVSVGAQRLRPPAEEGIPWFEGNAVELTLAQAVELPKVLLHDHLDGGLRPETVIELADEIGWTLPSTDVDTLQGWFTAGAETGDLLQYLATFDHTLAVMQSAESIERVAYEAATDLAADGVVYAEIRFAPELHVVDGLSLDEVVDAVTSGFRRGETDAAAAGHSITVNAICCAMRTEHRSLEIAQLVDRLRHTNDKVVAFDLAGAETGFPPSMHAEACAFAREVHLNVTIHASEPPDLPLISDAIAQGAHRVGHGVRLAADTTVDGDGTLTLGPLAQFVLDHQIHLEMAPTCNVQIGAVDSIADHPIGPFLKAGLNVGFNTDNRLMSHVMPSSELLALSTEQNLTVDEMERLVTNAAMASFAPYDDRRRLVRDVIAPGFASIRA